MRIFKRIVIALAATVGLIVLALIGSVVVDTLLGRGRLDGLTNARIPNPTFIFESSPPRAGAPPARHSSASSAVLLD